MADEPVLEQTLSGLLPQLLECVHDELETRNIDQPGFQSVHIGAVPFDHIGEGDDCDGELYVALGSGYASTTFPEQALTPMTSLPSFVWPIEVGIVRCMPQSNSVGDVPDEEELLEVSLRTLADMQAIKVAICRCLEEWRKAKAGRKWAVTTWIPYGPDTAAGGTWSIFVGT